MKSTGRDSGVPLTPEDLRRYSRHLLLPEVGVRGQRVLKNASVLLVGVGGLGSPLALYLAAAGVGHLGIVDFDVVDESNLQRQVLHGTDDVGRSKIDSAVDRLRALNPHVRVTAYPTVLSSANALDIVRNYDVVADGSDNFPTRYLVNDAGVLCGVPVAHASMYRFDGQASVFGMPDRPCYRCVFPQPPPPELVPSCAEGGILGAVPGIMGTIQAAEVLKLLLGVGQTLAGRLLLLDVLAMEFRTMTVHRSVDCPVCGDRPTIRELVDYEDFCGSHILSQDTESGSIPEITAEDLHRRLVRDPAPRLLDVRHPEEALIASLGGTLIPLDELETRLHELADWIGDEIVVYCRTGRRSALAVGMMARHGFAGARNLVGGIRAWSERIDPGVPVY